MLAAMTDVSTERARPAAPAKAVASHRTPMEGCARAAFSLVEVVIAIGVFAVAIIFIIGLLTPSLQSTREVLDSTVAARLADGVEAELKRAFPAASGGLDTLEGLTDDADDPLVLYATMDGSRICLHQDRAQPETGSPPGIPVPAERYFVIYIGQVDLPDPIDVEVGSGSFSCIFLPLNVRVEWPYVPQDEVEDSNPPPTDPRRSVFLFNTALTR